MQTGHRFSVLLRGLGILVLIMLLAAAAGVLSRGTRGAGGATPTVLPSPAPTAVTPTSPVPTPSTASLAGAKTSSVTDPATGMTASVRSVRVAGPRAKPLLLLDVEIRNTGKKPAAYGVESFFAVASNGATVAGVPAEGHPPLRTGTLAGRRSASGWVAFSLPATGVYVIIWNDQSRLALPGQIASVTVR